jgi:hypothetical protein
MKEFKQAHIYRAAYVAAFKTRAPIAQQPKTVMLQRP